LLLTFFSKLTEKKISKVSTPEADSLLQTLLQEIPSKGTKKHLLPLIMTMMNQPFSELRYAVYDVLTGLASSLWGVEKELQYPGFYEWLTNRKSEDTKAGKEWKYTIVQVIVQTLKTTTQQLLDKPKFNELLRYLKSGVFWVDAEATLEIKTQGV